MIGKRVSPNLRWGVVNSNVVQALRDSYSKGNEFHFGRNDKRLSELGFSGLGFSNWDFNHQVFELFYLVEKQTYTEK